MENFNYKKNLFIVGIVLGVSLTVLALVYAYVGWNSYGKANGQFATITVSGEGEAIAKPDIATVTFTVYESAKTVPEAQKLVEAKVKAGLAEIKSLNIEDKDIKTDSYYVNPKYTQSQVYCITYPCPQPTAKIDGYEVRETITVKIRDIEKAGEALGLIGKANITEMSGPNFTVDDTKKLEEEAKGKAIAEAKAKAKKIAKDLGVSLGEISNYSENGGYYPVMMKAEMSYGRGGAADSSVTVPQGETNVRSNVTITYTIK